MAACAGCSRIDLHAAFEVEAQGRAEGQDCRRLHSVRRTAKQVMTVRVNGSARVRDGKKNQCESTGAVLEKRFFVPACGT